MLVEAFYDTGTKCYAISLVAGLMFLTEMGFD